MSPNPAAPEPEAASEDQSLNKVFFTNDTIGKIEEKKARDEAAKKRLIEEQQHYTEALNAIFASDNGKTVLKHLIQFCGIFKENEALPDGRLAVQKGRRQVYLTAIRPFLDKSILMEVETQ